MSHDAIYPDRWQRAEDLSNWQRKHLDRLYLGITDLDGFRYEIRYSNRHPKGVLKFGFFEFKSQNPIMGPAQLLGFQDLHQTLLSPG